MRAHFVGCAVVLAFATTVVCAQRQFDPAQIAKQLNSARARWTARRPANYEFVISVLDAHTDRRHFDRYRVVGTNAVGVGVPSPYLGDTFAGTIDVLFDLTAKAVATGPDHGSMTFDADLGFPTGADIGDVSFTIPALRAFSAAAEVEGTFVLIQHENHCGLGDTNLKNLNVCPEYAIALWADGTVGYLGVEGVKTLGRRQHHVTPKAVRAVEDAIAASKFFDLADDYRTVVTSGGGIAAVDHAPEQWVTVRNNGRTKTVHDFFGTPAALKTFEHVVELATDSHRYTGRNDTESLPH